jgi:hypothetical protein
MMPALQDHLKQAVHNENFYSSFNLNKTPYLDWVVTGIFYSALHYVDSYFATQNKHPLNHSERNHFISHDQNLGRNFYTNYRGLKDDSNRARYNMRTFTSTEINNDIVPVLKSLKQFLNQYVPQIK